MTKDEAIMILKNEQPHCGKRALFPEEKRYEAYDVAIKALEQQTCEDVISRQATVERLCKVAEFMNEKRNGLGSPYIMAALFIQDNKEEFPSVQPKTPVCEDAVSRQAVLDAMYALCDTGETLKENPWRDNPHIDAVVETIEQIPSVNPHPKTGQWIYDRTRDWDGECKYECSECGMGSDVDYAYCMRCGAKMVEPQESEE